jgi:hypothetical protein
VRFLRSGAQSVSRVFWDVAPCSHIEVYRRFGGASIIRAMTALLTEAVRTSETSVNFNVTTWRYIPEDTKLHTRRCEDLKSHCLILYIADCVVECANIAY